jgi:hypothetical protein
LILQNSTDNTLTPIHKLITFIVCKEKHTPILKIPFTILSNDQLVSCISYTWSLFASASNRALFYLDALFRICSSLSINLFSLSLQTLSQVQNHVYLLLVWLEWDENLVMGSQQ